MDDVLRVPRVVQASFLEATPAGASMPESEHPEVAFAGKSNVGKSSLLNALAQRKKLVRTSSTPGCTRALQRFRLQVSLTDATADEPGQMVTLDAVDLPGYGFAKRSKQERSAWGTLIEGYLEKREALVGAVIIIDVRRGFTEEDLALMEYVQALGRRTLIVATKCDKLSRNQQKPRLAELCRDGGARVIGFSAQTNWGFGAVWKAVTSMLPQSTAP